MTATYHTRAIVSQVLRAYMSTVAKQVLLSAPVLHETASQITVTLSYYTPRKTAAFEGQIAALALALSAYLGKHVSVKAVRVHYPYMDSYIFAQYLCSNTNAHTFINFKSRMRKYMGFAGHSLPYFISGIKVQLSGRIPTERVVPRVTTSAVIIGSMSQARHLDYSQFTVTNSTGRITAKVWLAISAEANLHRASESMDTHLDVEL